MDESPNSEQGTSATSHEEIKLRTEKAELDKLELEIEELKRGRRLEGRVVRFIPIITALISIAGFISGLLIFVDQQKKDRQAREEDRKTRQEDIRSRELSDYRT